MSDWMINDHVCNVTMKGFSIWIFDFVANDMILSSVLSLCKTEIRVHRKITAIILCFISIRAIVVDEGHEN
jgi:hypothetical protein